MKLSDRLCREGINCIIDRYETSPSEGWTRCMINQIENAEYVLVVCTEEYEKRFKGKSDSIFRGLYLEPLTYRLCRSD